MIVMPIMYGNMIEVCREDYDTGRCVLRVGPFNDEFEAQK
jgi:hypothetical protein